MQHLGRSRIALVLGIKFDYALAKYPSGHGWLSPDWDVLRQLHNTLGDMVGIESDMPDEQIIQEVHWWIAHDDSASPGCRESAVCPPMFGYQRYAEEFVRAARDFLDQERQRRRVALAMRRGGRLCWTMKTWLGEQCYTPAGQTHGASSAHVGRRHVRYNAR